MGSNPQATVEPYRKQHMGIRKSQLDLVVNWLTLMRMKHTGDRYCDARYTKQNWELEVIAYSLLGEALEVVHP